MKLFLLLLLFVSLTRLSEADTQVDPELYNRISNILKEYSKLKAGGTRAEFLKLFTPDGGLDSIPQSRFVYRQCPCIKVDVIFKPTKPTQTKELPTDTIKTISQPYLECEFAD